MPHIYSREKEAALSHERLTELLAYCPETGRFTNKIARSGRARVGAEPGTRDRQGYIDIKLDYRIYKAHRLAWFYVHGHWPSDQIDHINGETGDNRICNLREVSNAQNQEFRKIQPTNKYGATGLTFVKGKYVASIYSAGKKTHLGRFNSIETASAAYQAAKENRLAEVLT